MVTILSIIGTRPEAIKMAPVIKELERHSDVVRSIVCSTGQHREMLDQVLALFDISPDLDLNLMEPDQCLAGLTGKLFIRLDEVLAKVKPDCVLAQGDTTTVMVAALAAFYRNIPFGHVEAGLRTGDKRSPFPEEMNRRLADAVTDLYFAPTARARLALLKEGSPDERIFVTGNTVTDALLTVASRIYDWSSGPLAALPRDGRFVLVTAHRRESFGEQFRQLCLAIRDLAYEHQDLDFVYPVHLNPNVRGPVSQLLADIKNVTLLEPLQYLPLVQLMKRSVIILTDSGGIQEEAPSLGVPVLVLRQTTERPEGVEAGVAKLVGTAREHIVTEAEHLLSDRAEYEAMAMRANPYGDGHAATYIVSTLLRELGATLTISSGVASHPRPGSS